MSKSTLIYLVTQPYVNCEKLTNKQITNLLGAIERVRIEYEKKQLALRNSGNYLSLEYNQLQGTLQNFHIDTQTLIKLIKVTPLNIGLSSTSTTQISK